MIMTMSGFEPEKYSAIPNRNNSNERQFQRKYENKKIITA